MDSLAPAGGARSQDRAEEDRRVRPEGPPTGRWRLLGADGAPLTDDQRTVIRAIADARAAWILDANLHEVLRCNGLPCDAGRLRGLCAGPVQGHNLDMQWGSGSSNGSWIQGGCRCSVSSSR